MMIFRWAMRNGAVILFCVAIIIFVVSFSSSFFITRQAFAETQSPSESLSKMWVFFGAVGQGASSSVWAFLGACLLNRLDIWFERRAEKHA